MSSSSQNEDLRDDFCANTQNVNRGDNSSEDDFLHMLLWNV
jgi:hypothetical protein